MKVCDDDYDDIPKPKQKKTALDILLLGPEDEELTAPSTEDELKQFMSEPQFPQKNCPLDCWKMNGHRFPRISPVAVSHFGLLNKYL